MKSTVLGLLDFTAGYHKVMLDPVSRHLTAFVAMGLKGSGPYFQRSLSNTVLARLVYQMCEM